MANSFSQLCDFKGVTTDSAYAQVLLMYPVPHTFGRMQEAAHFLHQAITQACLPSWSCGTASNLQN